MGINNCGTVSGCLSIGVNISAIEGNNEYGGIVGYNNDENYDSAPVIENCIAIGCTINGNKVGAISGGYKILSHNYYYNCIVNGSTTNIGTHDGDIGDMTISSVTYYDGAMQVFSLALGEHITATPTAAYSYSASWKRRAIWS